MGNTVTMPGEEAHRIVRSQDGIQVMMDYSTDFSLANSDNGQCLELTLRRECRTELCVEESMIPNFNSITIPNNH